MSRCLSEDHISAVVSSPHDDDPLQSCSGLFPDLGDSKADRLGFDCVYRGLKTLRHDLTLDRGVSFQAASRKLEHEQSAGDRSGFMRSRCAPFSDVVCLLRCDRARVRPCLHGLSAVQGASDARWGSKRGLS